MGITVTAPRCDVMAPVPDRRRGAIQLTPSACTSCMICVRECPVWCIELTAEKHHDPTVGPRGRSTLELTDFRIDYGLCMDCGICVDVCPTDALAWVPTAVLAGAEAPDLNHGLTQLSRISPGEGSPLGRSDDPT